MQSQPLRAAKASVFARWPVLAVVAVKCALTFSVAGRYGWHRDELYYAVAGLHLQGGYVEFPPVTALLSALARELFGWSLVGFRAFIMLRERGHRGRRSPRRIVSSEEAVARTDDSPRSLVGVRARRNRDQLAVSAGRARPADDDGRTLAGAAASLPWPRLVATARSRRRDRPRDQVHAGRRSSRCWSATFLDLAPRRVASQGPPAGGGGRGPPARPEPRLGGGARVDERALLPESAAKRQRRDASPVHRQRAAPGRGCASRWWSPGRRIARPETGPFARSAGPWPAPSSRTSSLAESRTTPCRSCCSRSPSARCASTG